MSLVSGELSVDESLCDIERDAVLESAVALHPPGVLVVPHPHALRMPALVFAVGIPTGDVYVVHAAVVVGGTFVLVPLARCQSRSHVADAQDGQFANLAFINELLHGLVIPGVAQIKVDSGNAVVLFNQVHNFPFLVDGVGNGFLRKDVLMAPDSFLYLFFSGICQSKKADSLYAPVVKDFLFIGYDSGRRGKVSCQFSGSRIGIADICDVPSAAFLHFLPIHLPHSAEPYQTNFYFHGRWILNIYSYSIIGVDWIT